MNQNWCVRLAGAERRNGWEWGNGTIIDSYYYGSFPHSLLSTSKTRVCVCVLIWTYWQMMSIFFRYLKRFRYSIWLWYLSHQWHDVISEIICTKWCHPSSTSSTMYYPDPINPSNIFKYELIYVNLCQFDISTIKPKNWASCKPIELVCFTGANLHLDQCWYGMVLWHIPTWWSHESFLWVN